MAREVTVTWVEGLRCEARVADHRVVFDAAREQGGGDAGPSPGEMLLAAIGS